MTTFTNIVRPAYEISVPVDERRSEYKGTFLNKELGLAMFKGKGWYGSDGYCSEIKVIQDTDGNWWEIRRKLSDINTSTNVKEALKQHALSKLTDEERKVLGL